MKTIIHKGHCGIFSIEKPKGKKKFRLNFQGNERSAEIFIKKVSSKQEAIEVVNGKLQLQ